MIFLSNLLEEKSDKNVNFCSDAEKIESYSVILEVKCFMVSINSSNFVIIGNYIFFAN